MCLSGLGGATFPCLRLLRVLLRLDSEPEPVASNSQHTKQQAETGLKCPHGFTGPPFSSVWSLSSSIRYYHHCTGGGGGGGGTIASLQPSMRPSSGTPPATGSCASEIGRNYPRQSSAHAGLAGSYMPSPCSSQYACQAFWKAAEAF